MKKAHHFNKDLKQRHIYFIALGAALGTGLFLGSATAIQQSGPSVIFAYILCGVAVFFIMRAMGEMALQAPHLQSFSNYVTHFLSPFAGYVTGWSYVLQMAFVCLADVTAFATYMAFWYPEVSPWVWTLALALILCAVNLSAVKIYGELEFLFSIIKISAIVLMIIGGLYLLTHGLNSHVRDFNSLPKIFQLSYWFPHNWQGFVACLPIVIYSFGGIEVIGITAAEAREPEKSLPKAINAIPARIVLFYVMSLSVLLALYPWQQIGLNGSPFVTICEALGIHSAANILNIIVITSVASAINSDIYGSSRMIYSLSREGHALKCFNKLGRTGTPIYAIFLMLAVLIFGVVFNYCKHDGLFVLMADSAAIASMISWILILFAQFFMRLKLNSSEIKFKMPLWPYSGILTISFMLFVISIMSYYNEIAFACGAIWIIFLALTYNAFKYFDKKSRFVRKI